MKSGPLRDLLYEAASLAADFLEQLPSRRVRPERTAREMLERLDQPLAETGERASDVLRDLVRRVDPGLMAMPGGRFFGWVIGGALPAALAADWLTSAWDQNTGMAEATPAAAAAEAVALRWIAEVLSLPEGVSGALVTGGQMANTVCLAAARHHVLGQAGWDVEADGLFGAPKIEVILSDEQHDTVDRSLRLLGIGTRSVRRVACDEQGRMRPEALDAALATASGPTIVCAQVGNVNSGAIDPLPAIADRVDRARAGNTGRIWLHVDGAFGLWVRASLPLRDLAEGAERADSWGVDAHKWLNTPYDCGMAFTRHPDSHRGALTVRAAYLPLGDDPAVRNPVDWTPELSRRARGFAVYAALRQLGRSGVAALVDECCAHARRFAERLGGHDGIQIVNDVVTNQVLVRFEDPSGADSDAHTERVIQRVQADGTCFMSGTRWHGRALMRISVSNWRTDTSDVDASVAAIVEAHRSLRPHG